MAGVLNAIGPSKSTSHSTLQPPSTSPLAPVSFCAVFDKSPADGTVPPSILLFPTNRAFLFLARYSRLSIDQSPIFDTAKTNHQSAMAALIWHPIRRLLGGQSAPSVEFDPKRDVPSLAGKVILITGGAVS